MSASKPGRTTKAMEAGKPTGKVLAKTVTAKSQWRTSVKGTAASKLGALGLGKAAEAKTPRRVTATLAQKRELSELMQRIDERLDALERSSEDRLRRFG